MKKFYFWAVVLFLAFMLIGCSSIPQKQTNFEVTGDTSSL